MNESTTKKRGKPENLKPFKKGQSGNPNGRPPGKVSIQRCIKEFMEKPCPPAVVKKLFGDGAKGEEVTNMRAAIQVMFNKGITGNSQFMKLLLEYGYGKPSLSVDMGEEKTVKIIFEDAD